MTFLRMTYVSLLFNGLAWLSLIEPYAAAFYLLLWVVPIFTSFSFFMILRQLVQHGNGDRGWLTNTRVFFVNPADQLRRLPAGPGLSFAAPPLRQCAALSAQGAARGAAAMRGIPRAGGGGGRLLPAATKNRRPSRRCSTCLGPRYHHRAAEVYIDNAVLDGEEVEEKDEILQQGEDEKRKRQVLGRAQRIPRVARGDSALQSVADFGTMPHGEESPMPTVDVDKRSAARRTGDEQIAAEPMLAPPELPADVPALPVENYLRQGRRRPVAVAGVVENGVVRPIDPAVKLAEHARVIIVTSAADLTRRASIMNITLEQFGLDRLSTEDRLAVAEAIWDSVEREAEAASLSVEQRAELERRLADSIARPEAVTPWEVIKARTLARARQ